MQIKLHLCYVTWIDIVVIWRTTTSLVAALRLTVMVRNTLRLMDEFPSKTFTSSASESGSSSSFERRSSFCESRSLFSDSRSSRSFSFRRFRSFELLDSPLLSLPFRFPVDDDRSSEIAARAERKKHVWRNGSYHNCNDQLRKGQLWLTRRLTSQQSRLRSFLFLRIFFFRLLFFDITISCFLIGKDSNNSLHRQFGPGDCHDTGRQHDFLQRSEITFLR